ncbi:MAG: hypothetical protein J7641_01790 [Cyanobacteria bacterium SID2]|nr:hypothetical protein [Cyanobacteria bacterium SID2]
MKFQHFVGSIAILATLAFSSGRSLADTVCPTELEPLIGQMLPDLPSYINRSLARSRISDNSIASSTVLVAGNPEFEPIPLSQDTPENVHQVFMTTLERTYTDRESIELQHFHWLFLVRGEDGWWLVTMFSSLGSYPDRGIVTPPEDSSQGAVAAGIRMWLRDCRARSGTVASRQSPVISRQLLAISKCLTFTPECPNR